MVSKQFVVFFLIEEDLKWREEIVVSFIAQKLWSFVEISDALNFIYVNVVFFFHNVFILSLKF